MNYKSLTLGDIRQPGDEVRSKVKVAPPEPLSHAKYHNHKADLAAYFRPTNLLGQPILASDFMHLEFRRPV